LRGPDPLRSEIESSRAKVLAVGTPPDPIASLEDGHAVPHGAEFRGRPKTGQPSAYNGDISGFTHQLLGFRRPGLLATKGGRVPKNREVDFNKRSKSIHIFDLLNRLEIRHVQEQR